MKTIHLYAAPNSYTINTEPVKVITLDSIYSTYCTSNDKSFLKIDTQGFENEVLLGSIKSLSHISGVELELSTTELYEQQKIYDYHLEFMLNNNFIQKISLKLC